jgi:activator of HSP90 ATPase
MNLNRRDFSIRLVSLFSGLAIAGTALGHASTQGSAAASGSDEVSYNNEAIHQEIDFKANRKRVFSALTESKQFNKVIQLSAAGMSLGNVPIEMSNAPGGTFSIFGGHIIGRQIELVDDALIVQAWRVVDWKPGIYSLARFQLNDQGSGTRLILDHTSFPQGLGQHLAEGWKSNYWEPLQKYLV